MFIKGKKLGLKDRKEMEELRQEQAEYGDNYVFHLPNRNLKTSISLLLCPYIPPDFLFHFPSAIERHTFYQWLLGHSEVRWERSL